jgi:aspartate carbamoyltransferase catalytic subunit
MATQQKLKHLIESQQLTVPIIKEIFDSTDLIRDGNYGRKPNGKILATLFYEPSTRTRLSFESAMLRLGGSVISTENAKEFSSAIKGESLEDTTRIVAAYSDCIVLRHHEDGAARRAASVSKVPVINGGDGKGQHPTQALLDLYTIKTETGRTEGLKVVMAGDLKNGRTVRSLSYLLGKFNENEIIFVSPEHLRMEDDIKDYLKERKVRFSEEDDLQKTLPKADIIYMTRIQKERMNGEDYLKANGRYKIDSESLKLVRAESRIMHPLPHVEEINLPMDIENNDKRVAYFRQAENGLYVRMAVLKHLLR